ncbi:hypothetical protein AB0B25_30025 [Nocardia sp. NPDC049190]|uniref:hypothetical protein n=1 Tax=Nocardia sp. NPDC049190 TaxID=3155650 RepID=UPI00340D3564
MRAELLEAGGRELWEEFMAELRERHLGIHRPATGKPTATERLTAAYEAAVAEQHT